MKGGELEEGIGRDQLMAEDPKLLGLLQLAKLYGIVPDLSAVGKDQPPKIEVLPGSLAEKTGYRSGDQITALNGRTIKRIEAKPDTDIGVGVQVPGEIVRVAVAYTSGPVVDADVVVNI